MKSRIVTVLLLIAFVTGIIQFQMVAQSLVAYDVDFSAGSQGIVKVLLNTGKQVKYKLVIQTGEIKYVYNLKNSSAYEAFPLQLGDGTYTAKIFENTTDTKYKNVYSKSSVVDVLDTNKVYLISHQQVNWTATNTSATLAKKLVADTLAAKKAKNPNAANIALTQSEIIKSLYDYVVKNMDYDYQKINNINYDYIPAIDAVLAAKSGICFDYSVLLAGMLRSQGIPAKLIKGYSTTTDVYHAWNEIYLASEKRWMIVDTTYDAYMYDHKQAYAMEKSVKNYTTQYAY